MMVEWQLAGCTRSFRGGAVIARSGAMPVEENSYWQSMNIVNVGKAYGDA